MAYRQRGAPHVRVLDSRQQGSWHLLHVVRGRDDAGVCGRNVWNQRVDVRSHSRQHGRQHGVHGQSHGKVRERRTAGRRHKRLAFGRSVFVHAVKDPRGPDPLGVVVTTIPRSRTTPPIQRGAGPGAGGGGGGGGRGYIQPGPWKSKLAAKDVLGVWLGFGAGAPKQYFIFKQVGTSIRGMVCGTCDNTYTMAALDDFVLDGDMLKFNILHEDWGDGELPTFLKHVACHVGWNELRCVTTADHQPTRPVPPGVVPGFSLEGPIAIDATAGNTWAEWPPKGTSR